MSTSSQAEVLVRFSDGSGIVRMPPEIADDPKLCDALRTMQLALVLGLPTDERGWPNDDEAARELLSGQEGEALYAEAESIVDTTLASGHMIVTHCGTDPALLTGDEFESLADFIAAETFPGEWSA